MSEPINSVKLTFGYENIDTTKIYTFNEVDTEALIDVKDKVKSINSSLSAGTDDGLSSFFVSENGDKFNKIVEARIIQTIETPVPIPTPEFMKGGN